MSGRRDCNVKGAAPRGVGKDDNLPLCWYHLVLNSPKKESLKNISQGSSKISAVVENGAGEGSRETEQRNPLLTAHSEGLIALQSCNTLFFLSIRKFQVVLYILI